MNSYRFDPYIGLVCRAGARGFTVSHCLGRSRRRPTEESQTHLRVATQVFVGGLRASTFDAKSTCTCDLAVMLNVATVSDKPPGIGARADPGGAPWLLLDRAAAAVWYVLVIKGGPHTTHASDYSAPQRAAAQNEAIIATATAEYSEKLLCARDPVTHAPPLLSTHPATAPTNICPIEARRAPGQKQTPS